MFNFILYSLLFLFGGALGSFSGVIVDRLYIKSFLTGRSRCDTCNRDLSWYELIPVFSFLFLRGRCRKCKVKIGQEKFWMEILGGVFAVFVYKIYLAKYFIVPLTSQAIVTGSLFSILAAALFVIFIVIVFYDLRHKLVPTSFSLILVVIGIAFEVYKIFNYKFIYGGITGLFWLDLFSGFLIALPFFLMYIITRKKGAGFGDIVIYFAVGYLAGFIFGVSIFFISVWVGAIVSIALMLIYPKKFNRKSAIPFAPFIIIATVIVMLFQIDILGFVQFLG